MSAKPLILLGGGGHGAVVAALARACGRTLIGVIDPNEQHARAALPGLSFLSTDDNYLHRESSPQAVDIAIGIGGTPSMSLRQRSYAFCRELGYTVPTLIHPFSYVADDASVGPGAQIMMGATVQAQAAVGINCIVNTRASVDHHCRLGDHAHLAPGSTLCGHVHIGESAFIGAGATVVQGVAIGDRSVVAAGAVVLRNVASEAWVAGVPARAMSRRFTP